MTYRQLPFLPTATAEGSLSIGLRWIVRALAAVVALVLINQQSEHGTLLAIVCLASTELILRQGLLPVIYAVALLTFPPGLLARNGLPFLIAAAIIVLLPPLLRADSDRPKWIAFLTAAPPIAAASLAIGGINNIELLAIVSLLSLPVYFLARRREFARRTIAAMSWSVALVSLSYIVSVASGAFTDSRPAVREFPNGYYWNVYFPYTPTVGGTQILGPGSDLPRFVLLTHEPGLSVFFVAIALSYFIAARGLLNRLGLVAVSIGFLATQSLGTYISVAAGAAAALVVYLWRKAWRVSAAILALIGLLGLLVAADAALDTRLERSAATLHDRGLAGGDTLAVGNVSLNVGLTHYKLETAILIIAITCAGMFLVRNLSTSGVFLYASTAVTASFNEPLQWQFGIWVVLGIQFVATFRTNRLDVHSASASLRKLDPRAWAQRSG